MDRVTLDERRVKTRTGTKIMLSSSSLGLTRIHTTPRFTGERPVTGCTWTTTAMDTMSLMARLMSGVDVTTSPYSRLMVGHHKFYGNMTVVITAPSRPKMKSSGTPTATPLRKTGESGAGNHSLRSRQCGV